MIYREELYKLHRKLEPGDLSRHAILSSKILSSISRRLDKYPIPYHIDYDYIYHLIININGKRLSIYNSGFDNKIEIARLKINGQPYKNNEIAFLTPKGAVNYILKKYGCKNE